MEKIRRPSLYLVEIVCSALALLINIPFIMHDLLFELADVLDPRVIYSLIGMGIGALLTVGLIVTWRAWSRALPVIRFIIIATFCISSITSFFTTILTPAIRFALLVPAAMITIYELMRLYCMANSPVMKRYSIPFISSMIPIVMVFWIQQELFIQWSNVMILVINIILAFFLLVFYLINGKDIGDIHRTSTYKEKSIIPQTLLPKGVLVLPAIALGASIGLYLSLGTLIVQNVAFENISTTMGIFSLIPGIIIIMGALFQEKRPMLTIIDGLASKKSSIIMIIAVVALLFALPWILATEDFLWDTIAGTIHLFAFLVLPLLIHFMLTEVVHTYPKNSYIGTLLPLLVIGFLVGVAGYLLGGNTYNVDFLIGSAFSIILFHGLMGSWMRRLITNRGVISNE